MLHFPKISGKLTIFRIRWTCRLCLLGTGCNACYAEKIENIETAENFDTSKPLMIINCEWGNYGADGEIDDILTEFDITIDNASSHKREQMFVKKNI